MFILNRKLNGVSSFKVLSNNIIYKDDESLFKKSLFLNDELIYKNGVTGFQIMKNKLIFSTWNNETFLRNLDDKNLSKIEFEQVGDYMIGNRLVFRNENNYFVEDAYNENYIAIPNAVPFFKNFLFNNIFISTNQNNTKIHAYTLPTATPLWQYDLSELGTYRNLTNEVKDYEVKHFIGTYHDMLIVQLSNASFLFLNIETGSVITILHLNDILHLPSPVFYDDAFPAHINDNNLIWLSNQRLIHIDLNTLVPAVIKDYFTEPRENQFRFMSNTFHDGKIYFVADYGWQYVTPSYVGVMNADSGEVLWCQQLENTGGLPEAPQVSGDKLYIRTNNKVLHIFEKESKSGSDEG